MGYWRTLDRRFWSQAAGQQLQDEDANTTEPLGYSVAGAGIGIYRSHRRVARLTADLYPLQPEDRIKISGSTSNDGVYEIETGDERTVSTTYTATSISFDAADDIMDVDEELDAFLQYDLIKRHRLG